MKNRLVLIEIGSGPIFTQICFEREQNQKVYSLEEWPRVQRMRKLIHNKKLEVLLYSETVLVTYRVHYPRKREGTTFGFVPDGCDPTNYEPNFGVD